MENRTQPILCCVGSEVAGEPTQFLMERSAAASHWDWHVITVEVSSDSLVKAWDGMVVMRFTAARFFPPHQAAAMNLVSVPKAEDQFIGGITSAMRTGDTWSMWHNGGPALFELLQTRLPWKETVCWLHGNSARTRSLLVACAQNPPLKILWTGSHLLDPLVATDASAHTNVGSLPLPEDLASQLPLKVFPREAEAELGQWISDELSSEHHPQAIVHAGDVETRHFDTLASCQPESNCSLLVVSGTPGTRRKLSELWKAGEVTILTPADLIVAEEAYDQARWTGQSVNIEVLKEAYDEYADF